MLYQKSSFRFNLHASALLAAIRAPADLTGTAAAVRILSSCLTAAAELWPTKALIQWALVPAEMQAAMKSPPHDLSVKHLYDPAADPSPLFESFLGWRIQVARKGIAFEAHALLGRAIVHRASMHGMLPVEMLSGLLTFLRVQESRGRPSPDWQPLIGAYLSDTTALNNLQQRLRPSNRPWKFLECAIEVLDGIVLPPDTVAQGKSELGDQEPTGAPNESSLSLLAHPPSTDSLLSTGASTDSKPHISGRLAAADYSGFPEKLGLYHRDQLLVEDLAITTAHLARLLQTGTPVERGFALLAIMSLVTGCSDEVALLLKFQPSDSIWIDLLRGAWAWDFSVYRQSKSEPADTSIDPVYCPWPAILDPVLHAANGRCPGALILEDLILEVQQAKEFDLKGFRQFLRNCGHPSHPPYRARFAQSMSAVYLQTSGSDMTTALMTGFFASTAPAALFYYGPTYDLLAQRVSAVYERLSLGLPSQLFLESGRAGCNNVLEFNGLRKGWARQVEAINACRIAASSTRPADEILDICNRWLSLLCAALVTQTGHRGTRLECLTVGALFGHPSVMSVQDKDEGGRAQPRLIPKTIVVREILDAISDCHRAARQIAHHDATHPRSWTAVDPVFVRWQWASDVLSTAVLSTSAIAAVTSEFFDAKPNVGRCLWVTHLDESGCDRWLTRSLTGHTRDVTRVHGPYFDISPLVAAARLGAEMDKTGSLMFGNPAIQASRCLPLPLISSLIKPRAMDKVVNGPVPDPRTILEPLSSDALMELEVANRLRRDLIEGSLDAPLPALAALHLALIDLIPDSDLCLDAVVDRQTNVKIIANCTGLQWVRNHFVHPTWMPIQPVTARLLNGLGDSVIAREALVVQICQAIREKPYAQWPTSNARCWEAIHTAASSFRRLTFPPSLSAVSHLSVGAPCLSELSLNRLGGVSMGQSSGFSGKKPPRAKASGKSDDAGFLIKTLGKFASNLERHGEKRMRAIKCLDELDAETIVWTPFILWIKQWCVDELRRSRDRLEGCYQISSLQTYSTTLLVDHSGIDLATDPADWEDAEWAAWITQINTLGSAEAVLEASPNSEQALTDRTKNAVGALVRSLIRRREYVPLEVRLQVGLTSQLVTPRGSASACLITPADQAQALAISYAWNIDVPSDYALIDLRKTIGEMVPVRSGDVSSLVCDCLTPAGGLVIKRAGYDVHKNQNAVRVIPLSPGEAHIVRTKIKTLSSHFGDRTLLLRGHGSVAEGLRDHRLATEWGVALKLAVGDASARPHSIRATTLQEMAWPGWIELSSRILNRTDSPIQCQQWVEQQDWCDLAQAVAKAGQGDLRSALGNYLAGWPMVFAIHARASVSTMVPGAGLLRQLVLSPANLRQAKSRSHKKPSPERIDRADAFDGWGWIASQTTKKLVERNVRQVFAQAPAAIDGTAATKDGNGTHSSTEQEKLLYLVLRSLGLTSSVAVEKSKIKFRVAVQLDPFVPVEKTVATAVSRGRQGPETRGAQADIKTALSSHGLLLLDWLRSFDAAFLPLMSQALFRSDPHQLIPTDKVTFWRKVAESLPAALSVRARIGAKHLTSAEKSALGTLSPMVLISPDLQLGERPVVSIHLRETENRVLSARLTAVARVCVLAIDSLDQFNQTKGLHAH